MILEGRFVRLEPVSLDDVDRMVEAGREWNLTPERVRSGIAATLREQAAGTSLPFARIERG